MKRLLVAFAVYAVLAGLAWTTLSDPKFKYATAGDTGDVRRSHLVVEQEAGAGRARRISRELAASHKSRAFGIG